MTIFKLQVNDSALEKFLHMLQGFDHEELLILNESESPETIREELHAAFERMKNGKDDVSGFQELNKILDAVIAPLTNH